MKKIIIFIELIFFCIIAQAQCSNYLYVTPYKLFFDYHPQQDSIRREYLNKENVVIIFNKCDSNYVQLNEIDSTGKCIKNICLKSSGKYKSQALDIASPITLEITHSSMSYKEFDIDKNDDKICSCPNNKP